MIAPLCQQAMDLGFDGLIVESHCSPEKAWSDAAQQVTPDILDYILSLLVVRDHNSTTEELRFLRTQIDEIDNSLMGLLAKRFRICREIGTFKKEHNMTILVDTMKSLRSVVHKQVFVVWMLTLLLKSLNSYMRKVYVNNWR